MSFKCHSLSFLNQFSQKMGVFLSGSVFPEAIAVGVSGGPDSMGLLALAWMYCQKKNLRLEAMIVDHGLRPDSYTEAKTTEGVLQAHGVIAHILSFQKIKVSAKNLQLYAREGRYRLMADQCQERGIYHLLIAHTMEDQAETLLHRFLKGSGVQGLGGMQEKVMLPSLAANIWILRPCLTFPKKVLRSFWGGEVVEDPSNKSRSFSRIRHRFFIADEGEKTSSHICTAGKKMALAWDCLHELSRGFLKKELKIFPWHAGFFSLLLILGQHPYLRNVILSLCLKRFGGRQRSHFNPGSCIIEDLCAAITSQSCFQKTVFGCVVSVQESSQKTLSFSREPRFLSTVVLKPKESVIWDHRYMVRRTDDDFRDWVLKPLGESGRILLKKCFFPEQLTYAHSLALPSLWCKNLLLWCGFYEGALPESPCLEVQKLPLF